MTEKSPFLVVIHKWEHEGGCYGNCGKDNYKISVQRTPHSVDDSVAIIIPVSDLLDEQGNPHGEIQIRQRYNTEEVCCSGWTWFQITVVYFHNGERKVARVGNIDPYDEFEDSFISANEDLGINMWTLNLAEQNLFEEGEIDSMWDIY
jgi:hypothetical protein